MGAIGGVLAKIRKGFTDSALKHGSTTNRVRRGDMVSVVKYTPSVAPPTGFDYTLDFTIT